MTEASDCLLVLDPAWTPDAADLAAGRLALRQVAGRVLAREDYFPMTTRLLDDWAVASGVVDAMTVDGTSFWYRRRLWAWRWLHERLILIGILDEIARERPLAAVALPAADDQALLDAIYLVARRDGLEVVGQPASRSERGASPAGENDGGIDAAGDRGPTAATIAGGSPAAQPAARIDARPASGAASGLRGVLRELIHRTRLRPSDRRRHRVLERRDAMDRRLDSFAAEGGGPLLAVVDPETHQEISTATGSYPIDPFLGPILDRLAGGPLDPIVVELGSRMADDGTWARISPQGRRIVPGEIVDRRFAEPGDEAASRVSAAAVEAALKAAVAPLPAAGVDLGPVLRRSLQAYARDALPARLRVVARTGRLLATIRPAAILTVDEYGRTEWLSAARRAGVPVVAVQHGIIHQWHPGYQHRDRPASRPIPDRTYVFGDFERRLLTQTGGYRPDEVVVSGSPRLDLRLDQVPDDDRQHHRAELGVGPQDRLIVVSTTFAAVFRRFYTPVVLAELLGRPVEGQRIVIKLHPGEADGELYRRLLGGLAAEGHHRSDLAIVKRTDLYRLLAAADAHLGLYSTVLTEAVAVGTPNLLAATQASSDLLGYVPAGVAIPVRTAGELEAALAAGPPPPDPGRRAAFLADHFLPGSAAERIATDLVAWLHGRAGRLADPEDASADPVRR